MLTFGSKSGALFICCSRLAFHVAIGIHRSNLSLPVPLIFWVVAGGLEAENSSCSSWIGVKSLPLSHLQVLHFGCSCLVDGASQHIEGIGALGLFWSNQIAKVYGVCCRSSERRVLLNSLEALHRAWAVKRARQLLAIGLHHPFPWRLARRLL